MSEIVETVGNADEKYLVFSVLGRMYAFPTRFIGEIALFDAVYRLPLMPPFVLGVINRYSIPYALFDIGLLLFDTPSPSGKVLVLKDSSIDRIAFLIDDVNGIADVQGENLLHVERGLESDDVSETVAASFSWNGSDVFVLDIHRVLARVVEGG